MDFGGRKVIYGIELRANVVGGDTTMYVLGDVSSFAMSMERPRRVGEVYRRGGKLVREIARVEGADFGRARVAVLSVDASSRAEADEIWLEVFMSSRAICVEAMRASSDEEIGTIAPSLRAVVESAVNRVRKSQAMAIRVRRLERQVRWALIAATTAVTGLVVTSGWLLSLWLTRRI
jgi:hypothetical protein